MKKILLLLLVAALAGVALYFSLASQAPEPRETQLPTPDATDAPRTAEAGTVPPDAPGAEATKESSPEAASAEQRAVRVLDLAPMLPPEKTCTLAVHARAAGGAPSDDAAQVLVVGNLPKDTQLEEELALLGPSDPKPSWLLARVPVDPRGVTEIALEKRDGKVGVHLRGRFSYAEPLQGVDISGPRAEAKLTAQLGACVRGRLIAPPDASDAERELARCELDLRSDPMEGQGVQTGAKPVVVDRDSLAAASGAFEFGGVAPGKALTLSGSPAHLAAFKQEIAALTAGHAFETEIALKRGATLSGRVVDESGAGVADAKLKVRGDAVMLGFGGRELRESVSREDGAFTLEAVAAGKVMIDVAKDGYLDSTKTIEAFEGARTDDLVLHLGAGARIAGRVRWQDGTPCATAQIDVEFDQASLQGMGALNARFGAKGSGKSDESGAFSVGGLGKGPFTVKATAPSPGETSEDAPKWIAVQDAVKPDTLEVELSLRPPSDVAGRVVDDAGAPVAECTVVLAAKGRNAFVPSDNRRELTVRDPEGKFEARGLTAGAYTALARHATGTTSAQVELELPREAAATELVLTLPRPAFVSGRVMLPDGSPAAGARVGRQLSIADLSSGQMPGSGPSAQTDADGKFSFDSLSMGTQTLQATKAGFAPSEGVPVAVTPAGRVEDVVLSLRIGGTITGEVYDDRGKPRSGARVLAQMADLKYGQTWAAADSAGKFEIAHVAAGSWQVMTFGDGQDSGDDESAAMSSFMKQLKIAMVNVKDGETTHVVLGAPPKNPVHVRGRVSCGNAGIDAAMVSFLPSENAKSTSGLAGLAMSSTDKSGAFDLELQHSGAYLITVQKFTATGGQQSVEFARTIPESPEHSLELELPIGAIAGRVVDAENRPVKGARISLGIDGALQAGTLTGGRFSEMATDELGEYALEWLAPGRYSVSAGGVLLPGLPTESEPLAREVRDGIAVAADERVRVDFRLRAACSLSGKVLDASGAPADKASIFVRDEAGRPLDRFSMTATESSGTFVQKGLGAGRYTVSARTETEVSDEATVVLAEGEEAHVELRLEEGTMLVVTLSGADGADVDASFSVTDEKGRQVNGIYSISDLMKMMTEGGFDSKHQRIGPLARGKYTVTASAADGSQATKTVSLIGQSEKKVTLKLGN